MSGGVVETARRVAAREISAVEAVEASLEKIAEADDGIRAFLSVHSDRARASARRVDDALAGGGTAGPLAGVPVALKDNICVKDAECTCASKILKGYRPPYDAAVVERLEAAGAVIVGKTNLDEFAMGSSTENSAFQTTRNPHDTTRVAGGSSGGSAAAVAAGMVAGSLGSDTGGSVRQPGAFCGVVAMKPTYGRVSRYGLVAFASSLDQIGPFGRSVEDVTRLYEVIAGPDPRDSTSHPEAPAPVNLEAPLHGTVIAFPEEVLSRPGIAPEVARVTREAAARFEKLGARIETVDFPDLDAAIAAYYLVCTAEASSNLARYDGVRYGAREPARDLAGLYAKTRDHGFGTEVKRRIMLGTFALSSGYYDAYYGRAMKARAALKRRFREIFRKASLLLIPTTPTEAFKVGEKADDPLAMYLADVFTVFANLIGAPAISVPAGKTPAGLPLGIQLIADDFNEPALLAAAHRFEVES